MIIKLIAAKSKPKEAERYARHLARYMAEGDRRWLGPDAIGMDYGLALSNYMTSPTVSSEQTGERALFKGAMVGGEAQDWEAGQAEAERRLALRSRKVKKPVRHGVLSCRQGEHLTEQGCADAVTTLAAELGCEAAAILWAAHGDTDNFHLHFMIVTVDPETGGALPFGQQPDGRAGSWEAMQRAIARIEQRQTLQPELGARYRVEGEDVVRVAAPQTEPAPPTRTRAPIRQEILDWEERSGFASFSRVAQDVAGPVLDRTASWDQLHRELAPYGIGIRRAGNGGELYAGDEHVKLSAVDRRHSWTKLLDRLGAYEEASEVQLAPYSSVVVDAGKAGNWLRHTRQQREIGTQVNDRVASLIAARDAAVANAAAHLSAQRDDMAAFDGDDRLRRDLAAVWPRLRASVTASIRSSFAARIEAVRGLRHAAAAAPDLDSIDLDAIGMPDVGIATSWHADLSAAPVMALDGFRAERKGKIVRYWQDRDRAGHAPPAMVDDGIVIWVNGRSDATVAAALILGRQRFGEVAVFGNAAYVRQCRQAAEKLGFEIKVISAGEARRRARRADSGRSEARHHAFERRATAEIKRPADFAERQRMWARAYNFAAVEKDHSDQAEAPSIGDVPHHLDIATNTAEPDVLASKTRAVPDKPAPKTFRRGSIDRSDGIDR